MTKIEILRLNIQDQNKLISDLDLACKKMEDLLIAASAVMFFHKQKEVAKWLEQYKKWLDELEKINE
jgi:hypothetical protein